MIPERREILLSTIASRPTVKPTLPPMQWLPGVVSPETDQSGRILQLTVNNVGIITDESVSAISRGHERSQEWLKGQQKVFFSENLETG